MPEELPLDPAFENPPASTIPLKIEPPLEAMHYTVIQVLLNFLVSHGAPKSDQLFENHMNG